MEYIVKALVQKLKENLKIKDILSLPPLAVMEKEASNLVKALVLDTMTQIIEEADQALLNARKYRKTQRLVVQRKEDPKTIYSCIGVLSYKRTYYKNLQNNQYSYPVDTMLAVMPHERLTVEVENSLVKEAITCSYAKSAEHVTEGNVSRQTVMNKIRESYPVQQPVSSLKKVPELHIDADEDHISLQTGKKAIVPLISVYEGIERDGKRGICKEIFHFSEFKKNADDLWYDVVQEIERRYDLQNTKIYLHGDGGKWIKKGLDWLPNATFVLDSYHKNKYLKKLRTNLSFEDGEYIENTVRNILKTGTKSQLRSFEKAIIEQFPEESGNFKYVFNYLANNFDAVQITYLDEHAKNGATEPHISHILSSRLSSRPHGWSARTLRSLAPLLAAKSNAICHKGEIEIGNKERNKAAKKMLKNTLGLPDPRYAVENPCQYSGSGTYHELQTFFGS